MVVTYLHWGVQGERCPSADQRSLARRLVGAGADLVVGSHAHELQGDGRLGPGYVAYGLGNFAWYSPGPTGVLTLTVQPPREPAGRARVTASRWWPATIGADGLAAPDSGAAAAASRDRRSGAARVRRTGVTEPQRGASHAATIRPTRSSCAGDTTAGTSPAEW